MKDPVEFVEEIWEENEALYKASELQIKAFYDSKPSKEKLIANFTRRMVNERMNLTEISKSIAGAEYSMDPKELMSLAKQALDEANHYRIVKDVVEYLSGEPVDIEKAVTEELSDINVKGAKLLTKYNCETDPIALALYQTIVEGHASRNWQMMADCLDDKFLSTSYAKIASDERFHSKLGRSQLVKLLDTEEKQQYAQELADKIRKDLYWLNCSGGLALKESRDIMDAYYGKDWVTDSVGDMPTVPASEIYK